MKVSLTYISTGTLLSVVFPKSRTYKSGVLRPVGDAAETHAPIRAAFKPRWWFRGWRGLEPLGKREEVVGSDWRPFAGRTLTGTRWGGGTLNHEEK